MTRPTKMRATDQNMTQNSKSAQNFNHRRKNLEKSEIRIGVFLAFSLVRPVLFLKIDDETDQNENHRPKSDTKFEISTKFQPQKKKLGKIRDQNRRVFGVFPCLVVVFLKIDDETDQNERHRPKSAPKFKINTKS